MDFDNILTKLIACIVDCIDKTEDEEQLEKYQRMLEYINMLIGVKKIENNRVSSKDKS